MEVSFEVFYLLEHLQINIEHVIRSFDVFLKRSLKRLRRLVHPTADLEVVEKAALCWSMQRAVDQNASHVAKRLWKSKWGDLLVYLFSYYLFTNIFIS